MGRLKKNRVLRAIRRRTVERIESEQDAIHHWKDKNLRYVLQDHLEEAVRKLDPLETGCIIGLTYFLYQHVSPIIADAVGIAEGDIKNEAGKLALSYVCAYLVTKYFGQIMVATAEMANGIADIVKWTIIGGAASGAVGVNAQSFWTMPLGAMQWVTLVPYPIPTYTKDKFEEMFKTPPKIGIGP